VWAQLDRDHQALHQGGDGFREVALPVRSPGGFFARAADDVWAGNGSARWDGKRWARVYGAPAAQRVLALAPDDVWLAGEGLWHGTAPGPSPVRLPAPKAEQALPAPIPLSLGAAEAGWIAERRSFPLRGEEPLATARSVSAAADGTLWIQDWDRLVEVAPGGGAATLRRGTREAFARRAHPQARGHGLLVAGDEVHRFDGGKATVEVAKIPAHQPAAVDVQPGGAAWVVGNAAVEERSPHALVRSGSGEAFRPVLGLPSATWCDVASTHEGGAWLAGGLSAGPSGEGILFHAAGRWGAEATSRYRARATLLAVAAVGPTEAWAVGAAGTVIHVRGEVVTRYALPSGEWLRAVLVTGPEEVWIGGDGGTLLYVLGGAFQPVAHPLGPNAAVTGLAESGGAVWAVGPSGILRISERRRALPNR
jgi:hypothetical protein